MANPQSLQARAAERLYGAPASKAAAKQQEPATLRSRAGTALYGDKSRYAAGGSLSLSADNYYNRRIAELTRKGDSEGIDLARLERKQVLAVAERFKMTPSDLDAVLTEMHERDAFPRSQEARQKLMTQTLEALRLETLADGSQRGAEGVKRLVEDYQKVVAPLPAELPGFVERANSNGAGESPVWIKTLAKYAQAAPSETTSRS